MSISRRTFIWGAAAVSCVSLPLSACSKGTSADANSAASSLDPSKVTGDITFLTNRTDLVDTDFKQYAEEFHQAYPGATVKFEALTDYEGETKIRMNTKEYGDVLGIPDAVTADQQPHFFEPLGDVSDMEKTYRWTNAHQYDGKVYGLAQMGSVNGIVYNTAVWKAAGLSGIPKSIDEFIDAAKKIKSKTSAIPYYTNYKDGWPLGGFGDNLGAISADPDAPLKLTQDDAPWTPGHEKYTLDNLIYQLVHEGLTEPDPTTTNWEKSKVLLGTGKIAFMPLGSWAIVQMQQAAKAAGKPESDIGFMPFPAEKDGKFHAITGHDYCSAINVNSAHKDAARAWVFWFTDKSGYATKQGAISTLKATPLPSSISGLLETSTLQENNPLPADKVALLTKLQNDAEVSGTDYLRTLVDIARGANKTAVADYYGKLNSKWAQARKDEGA